MTDLPERALTARQQAVHDTELVRRFNAGDETAFAEIMAGHRERLFSVALAVLKDRSDAEEIAQDAFIRAHRGLRGFRGDSSLATWLHRITLNLARNRYWYFFRRARHATVSLDGTLGEPTAGSFSDSIASAAANPARESVTREFSELVDLCMARLAAPHREILVLRNSLNRSYGEIARALGVNVGTVKSRIARARENLQGLLTETCPEFRAETRPGAWLDSGRSQGGMEPVES